MEVAAFKLELWHTHLFRNTRYGSQLDGDEIEDQEPDEIRCSTRPAWTDYCCIRRHLYSPVSLVFTKYCISGTDIRRGQRVVTPFHPSLSQMMLQSRRRRHWTITGFAWHEQQEVIFVTMGKLKWIRRRARADGQFLINLHVEPTANTLAGPVGVEIL